MFILWLGMIIIAALEIPRLLVKERRGELLTFAALWLIATLYASLLIASIPLPNPTELILSLFAG